MGFLWDEKDSRVAPLGPQRRGFYQQGMTDFVARPEEAGTSSAELRIDGHSVRIYYEEFLKVIGPSDQPLFI